MNKIILLLPFVLMLLLSCKPEVEQIFYGTDTCHLCKMTISDHRYGTQAVTKKGKVYKFDSVECMASFLEDTPEKEMEYIVVTDYNNPENLIDARSAFYLHSINLPSPMGMFLSAFDSEADAYSAFEQHKGKVIKWTELKDVVRERRMPAY